MTGEPKGSDAPAPFRGQRAPQAPRPNLDLTVPNVQMGFVVVSHLWAYSSADWLQAKLTLYGYYALLSFLALLLGAAISRYDEFIGAFTPDTPLAAKRANEQIKLLANYWNAVSVSALAVLGFSTLLDTESGVRSEFLVLAAAGSFYVHSKARGLLRHLKDEAISV